MALLKFKRSATPAKVPTTKDLNLGELALNTFDGKVYMKKDDGTEAIVEIGAGGGAAAGDNSDITSLSGITGGIATPDYIDFDTTAAPASETGRLWWDAEQNISTLNIGMENSDVTLQVGQKMFFRIRASAPITIGQVVMFTGTLGASGGLQGAPASGITAETGSYIMGVAAENIALNDWGYVTQFGLVRGINTTGGAEAWVNGQILYYNPNVAGGLSKNVPTAPNAKAELAAVVYAHASNGSIFVRVTNNPSLEQLSDIETAAAVDEDVLQYNGATGRWEHKSPALITTGTADQLTTARTITLIGDVTGSTSFDGSSDVSIDATLSNAGGYIVDPSSVDDDMLLKAGGAWTATNKSNITDGGNF